MESRLTSTPFIRLLREIIRLHAVLKSIDIGRVEKAFQKLRQIYHDKGNKAHTLLACKHCEKTHASAPQALQDTSSTLHSHPNCIAHMFCNSFSDLCNNPSIPDLPAPESFSDHVRAYLTSSGVTTLPTTALQSLDSLITEEEVLDTLKLLPNNKV